MKQELIKQYARLAIKGGVNLQAGQTLLLTSSVEAAAFTREVVREAYDAGAKEVIVTYNDEVITKYQYLYQDDETLANIHDWQIDAQLDYLKEGACRMNIISPHPGMLKECDPAKMNIRQMAMAKAGKEVREYTMSSKVQWTIVAVPNEDWAMQVYPELSAAQAVEKLWEAILSCVYVDAEHDPVETWKQRDHIFQAHIKTLNTYAFQQLHFTNALGTDLYVGLVDGHIWEGGSGKAQNGIVFNANIPTEEVFTMPHKHKVHGHVAASRPLLYNGNLIKEFSLDFEDGKVVDYHALEGSEVLAQLLAFDEGSSRLGEVALVPYNSPISQSNVLFLTTLFDENASCHLALGQAYPSCIEQGLLMDEAQMDAAGVNDSMVHVDFMFGSADMEIQGQCADGTWIPVFEKGNFVF